MKIMLAIETKAISKSNYDAFEKRTLEGGSYRRLINSIEEAALDGCNCVRFDLVTGEDKRILPVFKNALEKAGYKVNYSLFNSSVISIEWGGEAK